VGIATRHSLRDWLKAPGSLSRRLAALGGRFEVQVLRQDLAPLRPQERRALGACGLSLVREVLLRVDGEPLVWARSVVDLRSTRGPWAALRGLGSRPLAHLLYEDPRIQRSALRPSRISRCGPTRRQAVRQWRAATGTPLPDGMQWSRHSVFTRGGARLQVMELFAPEVARRRP
jgi:chorismate--pyruvate lyase